jgi:hypothetical protein
MTENITKHKQMTKQFEIKEWRKDQKLNGTWTNLGMRRPKSEVLCVGLMSSFAVSRISSQKREIAAERNRRRQPYFVRSPKTQREGDCREKSPSLLRVCWRETQIRVLRVSMKLGTKLCLCSFLFLFFYNSVFLWNDEKMRGKWNGFRRQERERIFIIFLIINNSF